MKPAALRRRDGPNAPEGAQDLAGPDRRLPYFAVERGCPTLSSSHTAWWLCTGVRIASCCRLL